MRYRLKEKIQKHYDTRVVSKFLFIPTLVDDEWRWLELVKIKQIYQPCLGWTNLKYIHDEESTSWKDHADDEKYTGGPVIIEKFRTDNEVRITINRKHDE